jgi:ABC-2 type transport system permease protein
VKPARLVIEIARWEFVRFFRVKDQVMSLLLGLVIGLGFWGVRHWSENRSLQPVRIAVLAPPSLVPAKSPPGSYLQFVLPNGRTETMLRAAVGKQELEGLLIRHSADRAELVVFREPPWLDQLTGLLAVERRQSRLAERGLTPRQIAELLAPPVVTVRYHPAGRRPSRVDSRIAAGILLGLMLMGIVFGSNSLFHGITGEKQLRVTEQVVAAVTPQTWIDGKLLGLCGVSLASLLVNLIASAAAFLLPRLLGNGLEFPPSLVQPRLLLLLMGLALAGFLFWFSFFATVAAVTDDPNHSSRPLLLFLPFLPAGLLPVALQHPDAPLLRLLSVLPISSPVVMPVRLVLEGAAGGEVALAMGLLVAASALLRRAAGIIFQVGMLIYGKEPRFGEVIHWLRRVPAGDNGQAG